jgi:hypothetical protein
VLEDRFAQRRRNDDAEASGDFGQNVTGAFGNFGRRGAAGHFALDPFAVFDIQGGL